MIARNVQHTHFATLGDLCNLLGNVKQALFVSVVQLLLLLGGLLINRLFFQWMETVQLVLTVLRTLLHLFHVQLALTTPTMVDQNAHHVLWGSIVEVQVWVFLLDSARKSTSVMRIRFHHINIFVIHCKTGTVLQELHPTECSAVMDTFLILLLEPANCALLERNALTIMS